MIGFVFWPLFFSASDQGLPIGCDYNRERDAVVTVLPYSPRIQAQT